MPTISMSVNRKVSGGVQKLYFCMGNREMRRCKNTIFALRDSRKTVSGGKLFDLLNVLWNHYLYVLF